MMVVGGRGEKVRTNVRSLRAFRKAKCRTEKLKSEPENEKNNLKNKIGQETKTNRSKN